MLVWIRIRRSMLLTTVMDPDAGPDPAIFVNDLKNANKKLIFKAFFLLITVEGTFTVGAQSIAHVQSIARRHTTYVIMQKKTTFREFFLESLRRSNLKGGSSKKGAFSPLKLLNKHFSRMTFFL
jgi:hypothetical protein